MPNVFISSTSEDLKSFRAAASTAARARFAVTMMEDFTASGARPPLDECLAKVAAADVVVVIVAHRYGWKPPKKRNKSVTWLECEEAIRIGKEVLAFIVDDACDWPTHLKDSHRITQAVETGKATAKLLAEVQADIKKLAAFKTWLNKRAIRATFSNTDELQRKVESALRDWLNRHADTPDTPPPPAPTGHDDPTIYLEQLRELTAFIDVRGFIGAEKVYRFPIQDLYIPLTTLGEAPRPKKGRKRNAADPETLGHASVDLDQALAHPRLVVVGDPGSGKTTFLRHLAFNRCEAARKSKSQAVLPIFISIAELIEHIRECRTHPGRKPPNQDSPAWLIHFLDTRNQDLNWGLRDGYFRDRLAAGDCLLLLDGLDEAPDTPTRESAARLFERATQAYRQCRFVVTTRPSSYTGRSVLDRFHTAQIEPLETGAINTFLEHWSQALFTDFPDSAKRHLDELTNALRTVPEISRMARNPTMLTALAVVHWNERTLPEQRADLYEAILIWLARAREQRPGRLPAARCLALLEQLALEMQTAPKGRRVQVQKSWAIDKLAPTFIPELPAKRRLLAQEFIAQEEVDSGIIVSRGTDIRFWHLTFQEYLAARRIAGDTDAGQHKLLLTRDRIYKSEWREVALLLVGVLARLGPARVDGLFSAVLDRLPAKPALAAQARCAGLLGAMVRDLQTKQLKYQPDDPRYQEVLNAVLGIFDAKKAAAIDFKARLEAAEALGQAGDPRLAENNWITIPGGAFTMGETGQECRLKKFLLGRYPVTVHEYKRFTGSGGYEDKRWWSAGGFGEHKEPEDWKDQQLHPNRPVVSVTWYEASAYCAWASGRLPTEQEWEFAAAGKEGREYPWGKAEPDANRANYGGWENKGAGHATPVGMYPHGATPDGLQDMAGNVWEWTSSIYDSNEKEERKVVRGGSWYDYSEYLRAAVRNRSRPGDRSLNFGFRCAREVFP